MKYQNVIGKKIQKMGQLLNYMRYLCENCDYLFEASLEPENCPKCRHKISAVSIEYLPVHTMEKEEHIPGTIRTQESKEEYLRRMKDTTIPYDPGKERTQESKEEYLRRIATIGTEPASKSAEEKSYFERLEEKNDPINPQHYKQHPSSLECIQITRHFNFNLGNVIKYLWRCNSKNDGKNYLEDLKKARWYLNDEINKIEKNIV